MTQEQEVQESLGIHDWKYFYSLGFHYRVCGTCKRIQFESPLISGYWTESGFSQFAENYEHNRGILLEWNSLKAEALKSGVKL